MLQIINNLLYPLAEILATSPINGIVRLAKFHDKRTKIVDFSLISFWASIDFYYSVSILIFSLYMPIISTSII